MQGKLTQLFKNGFRCKDSEIGSPIPVSFRVSAPNELQALPHSGADPMYLQTFRLVYVGEAHMIFAGASRETTPDGQLGQFCQEWWVSEIKDGN